MTLSTGYYTYLETGKSARGLKLARIVTSSGAELPRAGSLAVLV